MAVNKSDIITTADTVGRQIEQGVDGNLRSVTAYAAPASIADNDIILLCKVPVDAKIRSVKVTCDDWGTTGTMNVGFYKADGSTIATDADAVDEDAIGTAIDVNAAALTAQEIRFETKALSTHDDKAWELAGLSTRPNYGEFYLAITASAAASGSNVKHLVEVNYTV